MSAHESILAFGYYDVEGSRYAVIRQGLEQAGWHIIECVTYKSGFISKYWDLARMFLRQHKQASVILVPFQGHYVVPLAWLLTRFTGQRIVFDAFISLYDSIVLDRNLIARCSVSAIVYWCIDWLSCHMSDLILLDTPEHRQYFIDTLRLRHSKVIVVPIGCKMEMFMPQEISSTNEKFTILFHGTFIPLQGIETIIRAAAVLQKKKKPVRFIFIGCGQTYPAIKNFAQQLGLQNVSFKGTVPLSEVASSIARADCCLGIFGSTAKADRVIPHKAYEIIACGKPLITGDTTAARRYFRHGTTALLVPIENPDALAVCIEKLRCDPVLQQRLSQKGRDLYLETCQPATIVAELVTVLEQWQKKSSSLA